MRAIYFSVRWWRFWLKLLLLVLVLGCGLMGPEAIGAVDVYVSPSGNDGNNGTVQQPFRTIEKARDVVRGMNQSMTENIRVILRGGEYRLTSRIVFEPKDSGTNGFYVS